MLYLTDSGHGTPFHYEEIGGNTKKYIKIQAVHYQVEFDKDGYSVWDWQYYDLK